MTFVGIQKAHTNIQTEEISMKILKFFFVLFAVLTLSPNLEAEAQTGKTANQTFESPETKAVSQDTKGEPQKISFSKLTSAVKKTLHEKAGKGRIKTIYKMNENGKTFYEAEVARNGGGVEIQVDLEGKWVGTEPETGKQAKG
jgi:hypothetical protein